VAAAEISNNLMNKGFATSPMLRAKNLTKTVTTSEGELAILAGVNLEINAGESVAVVGASGSGKTTLLGLLAGLDLPTVGEVWLDGDQITDMSEEDRARVRGRCVGFVFQTFQLIESLSALENVMLPLELRGEKTARNDALEFLVRVGLGERVTHYPRQLSGGEQQRVAIARAFASRPKVLFADEPTGNLDTVTGRRVIELIFDLNIDSQTTLVLVTHDAELADRCDRRIGLEAGRLAGRP
jgi:putative ABC transport system ATP-binding protein